MPRATSCDGCGKNFSASKYLRSHLSQTINPQCQSERQAFLARHLSGYSPPSSPQRSIPPSLPSSPQQSPTIPTLPLFEPVPDTPTQQPDSEDDNTSDDTSSSGYDSEQDLGDQSGKNDDDDEHGRFLSAEEVANLQGEMWGETHIEVYPGRHAGAVHSNGIPMMKEFENTLGGPPSNPYSPFNSKADWELAKWAKLRGPSSTAFTELMEITSVCSSLLLYAPY